MTDQTTTRMNVTAGVGVLYEMAENQLAKEAAKARAILAEYTPEVIRACDSLWINTVAKNIEDAADVPAELPTDLDALVGVAPFTVLVRLHWAALNRIECEAALQGSGYIFHDRSLEDNARWLLAQVEAVRELIIQMTDKDSHYALPKREKYAPFLF